MRRIGTGMTRTVALAGILSLSASALAHADETIRVRINTDIRSTDPGVNRDAPTDNVMLHTVEGLVAYRENASVGPLLAESVDISEDGTTYTFTLREGITFHNGEPLTAAEVVWTWERYLDPETGWRCLSDLDGSNDIEIVSIEAQDDMTVAFTINEPSALFLDTMARTDCGMSGILHPDSVDADGEWQHPVGTGPFMLGEWRRGQFIELDRFEDYAALEGERDGYTGNKEPLVDHVRFVIVPDSASAKAALMAGDIDIVPDVSNFDYFEFEEAPGIEVAGEGTTGKSGILFQTRDDLVGTLEMRQAIAHALDMPQIVEAVSNGLAQPNFSIVPSSSAFHSQAHQEAPEHDLEKTRELLQAAGYQGEEIVLLANQQFPSMYDTAVYAQAMMQAAGINTRLEVLEWGTQLDRYGSGNYQMMAFAYSARLEPALSYEQIMGNKDEQPRKVWDNPEAQELLDEVSRITDEERRQEIFDELHGLFVADLPMIMLYNGTSLVAYRDHVQGFSPWTANTPRLFGVSLAD